MEMDAGTAKHLLHGYIQPVVDISEGCVRFLIASANSQKIIKPPKWPEHIEKQAAALLAFGITATLIEGKPPAHRADVFENQDGLTRLVNTGFRIEGFGERNVGLITLKAYHEPYVKDGSVIFPVHIPGKQIPRENWEAHAKGHYAALKAWGIKGEVVRAPLPARAVDIETHFEELGALLKAGLTVRGFNPEARIAGGSQVRTTNTSNAVPEVDGKPHGRA